MHYSQGNEEAAILDYFGGVAPGRFLDVGAFDGRGLSNTRALADRGWSGVLVEPDPAAFTALLVNCPEPRLVKVLVAVMPEPGLLSFSIGGAVSTACPAHRAVWEGAAAYREIVVCAVTPRQLLAAYPGPFDLFSLDVEGCNLAVLEAFPLAEMHLQCLCVEHEGKEGRIRELAAAAGLGRELLHNAENLILSR